MSEKTEWKEAKNSFVKFSKVGDSIDGTLVSVREIRSQLPKRETEMVKIYEIKADSGSFHDIDDKKAVVEPAIEIQPGEIWNVSGGSKESPSMIDNKFRNIKLGQKVRVEFTEELPPKKKGFSPTKVKKVYTNGKFDEEFIKEQEEKAKGEAEYKNF